MMPAALRRSSVKLSFVLMGVAFVAALTHMFSSTRVVLDAHTSTTPTAEAISRSYSMIKTEAAARSQRSHAGLEVAKSRRVSVSPGTFIHSRDPFAPQLHESFSFATEECRCPQPPDPADLLSSLNILNRQYEAQLPMPVRIARSPEAHASASSVPRKTQLVDLFSEVFVLNLPDRSDRRHYMCTIMQRLGSEALFWPAFSKYNPIVSAYYSDRKFATSDAIKDYMPPGPPPPTGVEQDAQDTSSKGEENSQQTQPVITEIQVPVLSQVEGDSNVTSADAPASNISWGEHPAPRPNKRKMFTRAQAACYVSHREVWHNIVHRQLPRPSLVLEDDVDIELEFPEIVGNAIRSLPDDWAVLFVGHCFEEKFSHQDVRIAHRVYEAIKPACTHSYVLRNATVASIMLEELGHDVLKPIDLGIISLIENKGDQIPMYVMLPPPITQLWRTQKRRSWRGGDVANPSDVVVQGLKLPLQRIVTPVKEVVVAEAAAAAELDPSLRKDGDANVTMPLSSFLDWGNMSAQIARGDYLFQGDVSGLLCNNPLFDLKPPEDAPEQLVQYPDSEYLP